MIGLRLTKRIWTKRLIGLPKKKKSLSRSKTYRSGCACILPDLNLLIQTGDGWFSTPSPPKFVTEILLQIWNLNLSKSRYQCENAVKISHTAHCSSENLRTLQKAKTPKPYAHVSQARPFLNLLLNSPKHSPSNKYTDHQKDHLDNFLKWFQSCRWSYHVRTQPLHFVYRKRRCSRSSNSTQSLRRHLRSARSVPSKSGPRCQLRPRWMSLCLRRESANCCCEKNNLQLTPINVARILYTCKSLGWKPNSNEEDLRELRETHTEIWDPVTDVGARRQEEYTGLYTLLNSRQLSQNNKSHATAGLVALLTDQLASKLCHKNSCCATTRCG